MHRNSQNPPPPPVDQSPQVPTIGENPSPNADMPYQTERPDTATPKLIQDLHDRIRTLMATVEHYETYRNSDQCNCPDEDFEVGDKTANVPAAMIYLKAAKTKANKENEDRDTRRNNIMVELSKLIADQSYITRGRESALPTPVGDERGERPFDANQMQKNIHNLIEGLTEQIMEIREPTIKDIVDLFEKKKFLLKAMGYEDIAKEKPVEFEKLLTACQAHSTIKTYLRKLTSDIMDMSTMKVPSIWREKLDAIKDDGVMERQLAAFREMAEKANEYCKAFFGMEGLHPAVESQNDINELLKIVRSTLPDTPEKYSLLASAVAKLNIMHLVDYINTKVSFARLKQAGDHIKKKMHAHVETMPGGGAELLCSRDGNPDNYVAIHALDTPEPKNEVAIARKFITRDLQFTRDFRLEDIKDLLRFSIILKEEDSRSPARIDKAIEKILGILLAMFGTDIPEDRLRYSFNTGITNGNSTGKHRAFHLTLWYRIQCEGLGLDNMQNTEHDQIPVEVQIRPFMFPEEVKADHRVYRERKDEKIRKYMGMEIQYPEFIRNLCEAILYCDDYPDKAKRNAIYGFERPIKEKWVLTIVSMLRKKTGSGALANEYTIRKICENPFLFKKVMTVLQKYAEVESGVIRQHKDDIIDMRNDDNDVIVRRYVKMLKRQKTAHEKRLMKNPKSDSNAVLYRAPAYDPDTEMDKIKSLSSEEIIADMVAMNGGWRKKLYEDMKNPEEERGFVETGINTLAKKGIKILEEYSRRLEKTRQPETVPDESMN